MKVSNFVKKGSPKADFMSNTNNPRDEAFNLFGEQTNFTPEELEAYREMIENNSVDLGVNIFDYFDDEKVIS